MDKLWSKKGSFLKYDNKISLARLCLRSEDNRAEAHNNEIMITFAIVNSNEKKLETFQRVSFMPIRKKFFRSFLMNYELIENC